MARYYELYKELYKTKLQRLITDFVIKRSAVQTETENANLVGVDSYLNHYYVNDYFPNHIDCF